MQARARRTRDKILVQARHAFAEHGYEATNVTEHILAPAGVSVGSFYHQFANKREVLLEIFATTIAERHARIGESVCNTVALSFGEAFRAVIDLLVDDIDGNLETWRIQWREHESPDSEIRAHAIVGIERWADVALRIIDPWYPGDHPNRQAAAEMLVMLGSGVLREYAYSTPERRSEGRQAIVDMCVAFAEAGVARVLAPAT